MDGANRPDGPFRTDVIGDKYRRPIFGQVFCTEQLPLPKKPVDYIGDQKVRGIIHGGCIEEFPYVVSPLI